MFEYSCAGSFELKACQSRILRPVGSQVLFNPGGLCDQNFAQSNVAVKQFVGAFYPTVAGPGELFASQLAKRGLIDCSHGPELAHFPFAKVAGAIVGSLREFATSFVNF